MADEKNEKTVVIKYIHHLWWQIQDRRLREATIDDELRDYDSKEKLIWKAGKEWYNVKIMKLSKWKRIVNKHIQKG